ncbi:hypothetical protein ACFLYE_00305 [Chloroflexota bacterium]
MSRVICITHRKNPMLQGFFSQFIPSESSVMKAVGREGAFLKYLKADCQQPWVLAVACHESTGATGLVVFRIAKTEQANVWKTLDEALKWASINLITNKMLVAVDEDIDVRDADSINWVLCTRMQPHRDCRIVEGPAKGFVDPSVLPQEEVEKVDMLDENRPTSSRLLVNATCKFPYPPLALPKKEFMERALQIWEEEKLPSMKLKEPWWGHNLGYWPDEEDEDARLAVRGDYNLVGEKMAKRRKKI